MNNQPPPPPRALTEDQIALFARHTFALVVAAMLVLHAAVARAESVGYVDTHRVRAAATEPKRLDAEFHAAQPARDKALSDAVTAAQQAKPADQSAAWAHARGVQAEFQAAAQKVDADFLKHMAAILAKLHADRHVSITAGPGVILAPGVDLTDEAIRRWDAADAEGMAAELARTRAENAALKAAKPEQPKK